MKKLPVHVDLKVSTRDEGHVQDASPEILSYCLEILDLEHNVARRLFQK